MSNSDFEDQRREWTESQDHPADLMDGDQFREWKAGRRPRGTEFSGDGVGRLIANCYRCGINQATVAVDGMPICEHCIPDGAVVEALPEPWILPRKWLEWPCSWPTIEIP